MGNFPERIAEDVKRELRDPRFLSRNQMRQGRVFFVLRTAATNYTQFVEDHPDYKSGDGVVVAAAVYNTIDAANNACTADQGDIIYVAEGHVETIAGASGVAQDIAGVQIIGLGVGNNRPVITFSAVASTWALSANNCSIKNIVGTTSIDLVTNPFLITGNNCTVDIEWQDGSSVLEVLRVMRLDTADNCTVKLKFNGFIAGDGTVNAIRLDDCDNVRIDIDAYGQVGALGWVEFVDVASTNVRIVGTFYATGITTLARNVVDTITGSLWSVEGFDAAAGAPFSGGSGNAVAIGDLSVMAADILTIKQQTGGTDSATAVLGADDADNGFASTNVVTNEDGSVLERMEQIQEAVNKGTGTALAANKSLVDAIGTDGTTVADTATGLAGMIGVDDADNAFASTNVVANEDGSLLERLEQVQEAVNKGTGTALAANKSLVDALGTDGTAVTDAAASVLGAVGADNANNAFASTLVAANEDGSTLERLEQIQEAVNVGTGTSLAANKSLVDALGTDGTTVADTAAGIAGMIGVDDADNVFSSSNVAANRDGSVLERLEYQHTQDPVTVTKTTAALPQTAAAAIFTVTGLVLVHRIVGYVTTVIGAVANATKLVGNSTGAGASTDLCGTLDINGHAVDSRYEITGVFANAMVRTLDVPLALTQTVNVVIPPGTIDLNCAGSDGGTGRIRWSISYTPLEVGANIVAA